MRVGRFDVYCIRNLSKKGIVKRTRETSRVLLFNNSNNFCRIPDDHGVIGNIMVNDAAGSNNCVVANGDAAKNADIAADPDIVFDGNWARGHNMMLPFLRIKDRLGGIHANFRGNICLIADCDWRVVH